MVLEFECASSRAPQASALAKTYTDRLGTTYVSLKACEVSLSLKDGQYVL